MEYQWAPFARTNNTRERERETTIILEAVIHWIRKKKKKKAIEFESINDTRYCSSSSSSQVKVSGSRRCTNITCHRSFLNCDQFLSLGFERFFCCFVLLLSFFGLKARKPGTDSRFVTNCKRVGMT